MFFPIGDTQVSGNYKPIFSYLFIAINILVFFLQISTEGNLVCEFSTIPLEIIKGDDYHTLISSIFMHGGWMHLIGNMLFLWVFADNIEVKIGNFYFVLFYLAGGIFASGAHIYASTLGYDGGAIACFLCDTATPCDENSVISPAVIPSLGASGAIAALMGAYLVMFPKSQIKVLVLIFFRSFHIPAIVFLGIWFVQQLFSGFGSLGPVNAASEGVAWWAHIGGFAFGLIAGLMFKQFFVADDRPPNDFKDIDSNNSNFV
jgi:membrane associated rhomboid family serine protease